MILATLFGSPVVQPQTLNLAANETIYEPQMPASYLYFVLRGEVRTFQVGDDGEGRLMEILGPQDWFNPAAFSSDQFCGHRAVSTTHSVVIRASAEKILSELQRNTAAAHLLLQNFADRLQRAREDAAHLVFDDCNTRLIRVLLQLSQTVAATRRGDGVELHITHHQLAQAVGAARETVSLALTDLRKQNLLRTGRNKLFFDPRMLRDLQHVCKSDPNDLIESL
jgi:CRP/FNR family transcriptional regulator